MMSEKKRRRVISGFVCGMLAFLFPFLWLQMDADAESDKAKEVILRVCNWEEYIDLGDWDEEDYEGVYALWMTIKGFGIRSIDDSRIGVERFLKRNPTTSVVAVEDGKIVGSILCGHDGRRGCLYHVCVHEDYRRRGIGKAMVVHAMEALKAEQISKVSLIAFTQNDIGNAFWNTIGWTERLDLNYYDFVLNAENITAFNRQ